MFSIQDLVESVKEKVVNTFKNPFLSTYLTFWSVHNWRIFYTLFSDDESYKLMKRIEYVDKWYLNYWDTLFLPLIVASVITLVYPFFSILVNLYYVVFQNEENKLIRSFTEKDTLTKEESMKIKNENEKLDSELKRLKGIVRDVAISRSIPHKDLQGLHLEDYDTALPSEVLHIDPVLLEKTQKEYIVEYANIKKSNFFHSFKQLVSIEEDSQGRLQLGKEIDYLDRKKLIKQQIISADPNENPKVSYSFTDKGKKIKELLLHDYK